MQRTTTTGWITAKKATIPPLVRALMLAVASAPALGLAAGTVTASGVLQRISQQGPAPALVYAITDGATGTPYRLIIGFGDLEDYAGQRVTIRGASVLGPGTPGAACDLKSPRPSRQTEERAYPR
jgi:hypothetical protein